ncbi:hypothetical protein F4778DRAFT_500858 [Xylariomycetidae sp. FL2044]|nr:hypothetical protein F4778DRAFT_500858 [Xylariomycetidae sp. FL2044]
MGRLEFFHRCSSRALVSHTVAGRNIVPRGMMPTGIESHSHRTWMYSSRCRTYAWPVVTFYRRGRSSSDSTLGLPTLGVSHSRPPRALITAWLLLDALVVRSISVWVEDVGRIVQRLALLLPSASVVKLKGISRGGEACLLPGVFRCALTLDLIPNRNLNRVRRRTLIWTMAQLRIAIALQGIGEDGSSVVHGTARSKLAFQT